MIVLSVNWTLLVFQILKMASQSSEDMFSEIDGILTCSNCHQHYKDSKLLPCSHFYCRACLDLILSQSAYPAELSSPSCQMKVPLTNGQVTSLPDAPLESSMVEAMDRLKHLGLNQSPKCSLCACANEEASSKAFCVGCMNTLCEQCIPIHNRLLDTHTEVTPCNDIQIRTILKRHAASCQDRGNVFQIVLIASPGLYLCQSN